jgi:membrane associated rhomboid family serine protease
MNATNLILLLMAVTSLIGLYAMPSLIEQSLFRPFWLLPRRQYFTLLSSGFVHANVPHLLFNALTLWSFGSSLEAAMGTSKFLALYGVSLLVSDWGTWLKHRDDANYASLGASGAILGVLFASIVYFPTRSLYMMFLPVPIPGPLFAVVYLAYTWYASHVQRGRINHDAHFSGALAGLAFVALSDPQAWHRALDLLLH